MSNQATPSWEVGGRLLGRYHLDRTLGRGGEGEVWLARDGLRGAQLVVLKRRVGAATGGPETAGEGEFARLSALGHPNLGRGLGLVRLGAESVLVQPYYSGGELGAWAEGRGRVERVGRLVELARALSFLHASGVVHGDVKAENAVIGGDGQLRLLDLGLARAMVSASAAGAGPAETVAGTPAYLAPELLSGAALSPAADVYAFGVLAHLTLAGRLPYVGDGAAQLSARAEGRAPQLDRAALGPLAELVEACLAFDPERRPVDGRALLHALWDAEPGEHTAPESPPSVVARVPASPLGEGLCALVTRLAAGALPPEERVHIVSGGDASDRAALATRLRSHAALAGCAVTEAEPPGDPTLLVPWLGLIDRSEVAAVSLGADGSGRALLPALLERVLQNGAGRPLLIVVTDPDAGESAAGATGGEGGVAGEIASELLATLARTLPDAPESTAVALVLACERRPATWPPWLEPSRHTAPTLAADGAESVLRRVFPGRVVPAGAAASLWDAAAGSPRGLRQVLVAGLSTGALPLDDRDGIASDLVVERPPSSNERVAAARAQLAELTPAQREIPIALALLGGRVPERLLDSLGVGDARIREALVVSGALRRQQGLEGGEICFADRALAEACRERAEALAEVESGHVESQAWASRLADALPSHGRERWDARVATLSAAGRVREAATAGRSYARALLESGAFAAAQVQAGYAVQRAETSGRRDPSGRRLAAAAAAALNDHRRAAEWLTPLEDETDRVERARRLSLAGEHRDALEWLDGVAEREAGPEAAEAQCVRARALLLSGDFPAADEAAARAAEAAGGQGDAAVHAWTTRGLVAFYQGDYERASVELERSRRLLETGAAPAERPFVLSCEGLVLQRRGDLRAAAERYRQSADVARLRGDWVRVGAATLNLGTVAQEAGTLGDAIEAFRETGRVARRLDDRPLLVKSELNLANLCVQVGAVEDGAPHLRRALAVAEREGLRQFHAYALLVQAEAAALDAESSTEEDGEPAACVLAARRIFEELGAKRELLECDLVDGRGALALGDLAVAARIGQALADGGRAAKVARVVGWGEYLVGAAESARPSGDGAAAVAAFRRALADGGQRAEDRWRVHIGLAQALLLAGDRDGARAHAHEGAALLAALEASLPTRLRDGWRALPERRRADEVVEAVAESPAADAGVPVGSGRGRGEEDGFLLQILELNKRLGAERDLGRLLAAILDVAVSLSGAERGFVLVPSGERDEAPGRPDLRVQVARNIDGEALRRRELKVSTSIAREVFLTGRPLLTVDALGDERLKAHMSIAAMKLRSVLCVPLHHRGDVLGVVYIDNRFQRGAFSREHLARLEAFADQAALALASAQALADERTARAALEESRHEVERLNRELEHQLDRRTADLDAARVALRDRQEALTARYDYGNIVGRSAAIRRVFTVLDRVTESTVPVLVLGESGTGKELVARALHYNGPRAAREMVALNCAALPETLLESELFGYLRGAFTGADRDRAGILERAHGGTLFLDEVGDMPISMQAKLLRVLESGEFTRLGDTRTRRVDVRVIAATNRDLRADAESGRFRADLLFRLDVVSVTLPPLRERYGDLPLLAEFFLERRAREDDAPRRRLTPAALALLERYAWPGNVRELEATLTSAALMAEGETIGPADLAIRPELMAELDGASGAAGAGGPGATAWDGHATLAQIETAVARAAVDHFGGNKAKAARALGVSRNTLYAKLKR